MKKLVVGIIIGLIVGSVLTFGATKIIENTGYNKAYKELQQLVVDYNEASENNRKISESINDIEEEFAEKYGEIYYEDHKYEEYPNKVTYKCYKYLGEYSAAFEEKSYEGYANWTQSICDDFYNREKELVDQKIDISGEYVAKEIAKFNLKYSKQYYLDKQGGYYYLGDKSVEVEK